jgi:hypothetical protein
MTKKIKLPTTAISRLIPLCENDLIKIRVCGREHKLPYIIVSAVSPYLAKWYKEQTEPFEVVEPIKSSGITRDNIIECWPKFESILCGREIGMLQGKEIRTLV